VRVLIFHGYLLDGTGSNVYNARLAETLAKLGCDVHLLSQDRHADEKPFVDAVGSWERGSLHVRSLARARPAGAGRCTVYRPEIGSLLPVYVADRYEGIEARTFAQCSDEEVDAYLQANVAAVRELCALARPQLALANHLVMGPVILVRALPAEVPFAAKIHGSALEYTVKPEPQRFLGYAREGLAGANGVLVGSKHTAASLWELMHDAQVADRTRLGPPGVDVERFRPAPPERAAADLRALAAALASSPAGRPREDAFARDEREAAVALARLRPAHDRLVTFVGKLIASKGVDLLLAAWPLVLERVPSARLVIIGFGAFREGLAQLCAALAARDLERARALAERGRALETGAAEPQPLRYLVAFLDGLRGRRREAYVDAAPALAERVVFAGRLEHEELARLLPACEALVVPSTFPEAFGMVAAEAAACGAFPVSADHSGLAEVSELLARALPPESAPWLSFPLSEHAVPELAARVTAWLDADSALRERTRAALVEAVRGHWSWQRVAQGVLAAARGQLEGLQRP
jgi:glycosyltransferase involved in cell wall biosynthesis